MKPNSDPEDPLVQSLAMDALELPPMAAARARASQHARHRNAGLTTAAAVLALAAGLFFRAEQPLKSVADNGIPPVSAPAPTAPAGFVRAYTANHPPPDNDIPADATAHEKELLTELRGIPVLLVRNERGEISQVHIFEQ